MNTPKPIRSPGEQITGCAVLAIFALFILVPALAARGYDPKGILALVTLIGSVGLVAAIAAWKRGG